MEVSVRPPSKRNRRDENVDPTNPGPSIVVHVRNLNPKVTEADLLEALSHFGPIAYATCMPGKRMALVEFEDIEGARACVVFAQSGQIHVAGQPALFNFSTSKMIQRIGLESEKPNNILILTICNAIYHVNVDVIHQICEPHGFVKRISMIRRAMLQALVEFDTVESARKAKHAMNGADIYSGCCTLKVEFAKPDTVKVTRRDDDQCDYTSAVLNSEDFKGDGKEARKPPLLNDAAIPLPEERSYGGYGDYRAIRGYGGVGYKEYDNGYGNDRFGRGGGGYGTTDSGYGRSGGAYPRGSSYYDSVYGETGGENDSTVVMVYGVDQELMNCDKIFNLLCLYGNCEKVNFMKSKPDTLMAQMKNPKDVDTVIENLSGVTVFGQTLVLKPSKQLSLHDIREPFKLPDGTPSFMDYTASRNHRFTTPELAARNHVVKPTNVLHWHNAPVTMTQEKVQKLFRDRDAAVPSSVTIFPQRSERSSAGLCEFETTEQATEALMLANNVPVDSPVSNVPYIVKFAFAASGRDGRSARNS